MNKKQLHILRHSLGIEYGKKEYRNHFVTGKGSKDYNSCMALVSSGHMTRKKGDAATGGDDIFFVTDKGRAMAVGE